MNHALGISRQNILQGSARRIRGDGGRSIRYGASRIIRGDLPRNLLGNKEVIRLNKLALRDAYDGDQAPAQAIAEDSGQSPRAAENWWGGVNPMGLEAFVNAYRNNARFAAFARYYLLGHTENDPILEIQLQTAMSNMDEAAARLGMPRAQFAAACGFAMGNTINAEVLAMDNAEGESGADVDDGTGDLFEGAD